MKEITIDVLKDAASRLMFEMTEEEYAKLFQELSSLTAQMEAISQCEDLDGYEPMTFPYPVQTTYLREDEPLPPLKREEALSNAGSTLEGQIKLPKVVG